MKKLHIIGMLNFCQYDATVMCNEIVEILLMNDLL